MIKIKIISDIEEDSAVPVETRITILLAAGGVLVEVEVIPETETET